MFKIDLKMSMTLDQITWLLRPFKEEPNSTFSIEYEISVAEHFYNYAPEKYAAMSLPVEQNDCIISGDEVKTELIEIKKRIIQEMKELDIEDIYLEVQFKAELLYYPIY